jgi:hypothetical protein
MCHIDDVIIASLRVSSAVIIAMCHMSPQPGCFTFSNAAITCITYYLLNWRPLGFLSKEVLGYVFSGVVAYDSITACRGLWH